MFRQVIKDELGMLTSEKICCDLPRMFGKIYFLRIL